MNLILTRDDTVPPAPDHLYGILEAGLLTLQTMERPWVPEHGGAPCGEPFKSCVPAGTYELVLHSSADHPHVFALVNPTLGIWHTAHEIPTDQCGRSECLIHSGNLASQSVGCILVGRSRSVLNGQPDVADSQAALRELMAVVPYQLGNSLTIV